MLRLAHKNNTIQLVLRSSYWLSELPPCLQCPRRHCRFVVRSVLVQLLLLRLCNDSFYSLLACIVVVTVCLVDYKASERASYANVRSSSTLLSVTQRRRAAGRAGCRITAHHQWAVTWLLQQLIVNIEMCREEHSRITAHSFSSSSSTLHCSIIMPSVSVCMHACMSEWKF